MAVGVCGIFDRVVWHSEHAEPAFTVRTNVVSGGGRRGPDHAGALAPPARPAVEVPRTEKADRSRGKHSSAARELSGRMEIVDGLTPLDESETTTTRLPRETCHSSGESDCEYVPPVASRSYDMR
jgi:hypothetical protein